MARLSKAEVEALVGVIETLQSLLPVEQAPNPYPRKLTTGG